MNTRNHKLIGHLPPRVNLQLTKFMVINRPFLPPKNNLSTGGRMNSRLASRTIYIVSSKGMDINQIKYVKGCVLKVNRALANIECVYVESSSTFIWEQARCSDTILRICWAYSSSKYSHDGNRSIGDFFLQSLVEIGRLSLTLTVGKEQGGLAFDNLESRLLQLINKYTMNERKIV